MKMRKRAARLAGLCLILAFIVPGTALAKCIVTKESDVQVYTKPSAQATVLLEADDGEVFTLLGTKGGWVKLMAEGKVGYARKDQMALLSSDQLRSAGEAAYVGERGSKGYVAPSANSKVVIKLKPGTQVRKLGESGEWVKLLAGASVAYVARNDVVSEPVSLERTVYAAVESLKIHKAASSNAAVVKKLEKGEALTVKGSGKWLKAKSGSATGYVYAKQVSLSPPANETAATPKPTTTPKPTVTPKPTIAPKPTATLKPGKTGKPSGVIEIDWWTGGIQQIFSRGTVATMTDVDTGISWREIRLGGTSHADCQPLTADDTAKLKKAVGGKWSWERRAIWVTVGGRTYAASMNCMPHMSDSMPDNDFPGHHCIHFTNSRTHTGNRLDPAHQAAIKKALAAAS